MQRVNEHLAAGANADAIAKTLGRSTHTVRTHLRNIYNKIGVSSRTAAARFAIENGLA